MSTDQYPGLSTRAYIKRPSLEHYERKAANLCKYESIIIRVGEHTRTNVQLLHRDVYIMLLRIIPHNRRVSSLFIIRSIYENDKDYGVQIYKIA